MSESGGEITVRYTAKELLARIDTRLESIDQKLDSKANLMDLRDLERDHKQLRDAFNAHMRDENNAEKASTKAWTRREKLLTLAIAVTALLLQYLYYTHSFHHG